MTDSLGLNPYIVGPPVCGPGLYGRQEIFRFVLDTLALPANRLVVLYGQRRVGKTSILQELNQNLLPQANFCPAFFNAQGQARAPFPVAIQELAATIATALRHPSPPLAAFESDNNYFLSNFLPDILANLSQRRLVLLIDEFDTLSEDATSQAETPARARFLEVMQTLVTDERWQQVAVVPVIGRRIEDLSPGPAQLFRTGQQYRVWTLPYNETWDLIIKPAQSLITYQEEAIKAIWDLTSGHPYFVQLLCFEVFNLVHTRPQTVVYAEDVQRIIGHALDMASAGMAWLWDDLTVGERLIISTFSEAANEQGLVSQSSIEATLAQHHLRFGSLDLTQAIARLVEMRILKHEGEGAYRFEVEMVRRWATKEHPIHLEQSRIDQLSLEAAMLYRQAQLNHRDKRLEPALSYYQQALAKNPNHRAAQAGLAQARLESKDLVGAVGDFEEAVKLGAAGAQAGLIQALLALGEAHEQQQRFIEANYQFRKVLSLEPDNLRLQEKLEVLYGYGRRAMITRDWAAAVGYLERVAGIQPDYKDTAAQLSEARRRLQPSRWRLWALPATAVAVIFLMTGGWLAQRVGGSSEPSPTTPATQEVVMNSTPTFTAVPVIISPAAILVPTDSPTLPPPTVTDTPSQSVQISTPTPTNIPPTPTATPTVILNPTPPPPPPPPTPYPAPVLLGPSHNASFQGANAQILLEWSSEGELTAGATYLVRLKFLQNGSEQTYLVPLQNTSWLVNPEIFNRAEPPERQIQWQVVVAQLPEQGDSQQAEELSPVSETRTFTWAAIPLPEGEGLDVVISPGNPSRVLAILRGQGIFKSDNSGTDWQPVFGERTVERLHIAPANPQVIYAGAFAQVLKSEDGGATWRVLTIPPIAQVNAVITDPDQANLVFAATDRGVLRSDDGGLTWSALDRAGVDGKLILDGRFYTLAVARTAQGNRVYVAGEGDKIHSRATSDSGSAWRTEVCTICARSIFALAVDPYNPNRLLAGSDEGRLGLSLDGGYAWGQATIPSPTIPTLKFSTLEFHPALSQLAYAGSGSQRSPTDGEGFYRSQDGGQTWQRLPGWVIDQQKRPYIQGVALDPTNSQVIFVASSEGVFRSEDGGTTWTQQ